MSENILVVTIINQHGDEITFDSWGAASDAIELALDQTDEKEIKIRQHYMTSEEFNELEEDHGLTP